MTTVERVDAFQRRHSSVGFPLGVVYKFVDDQGSYLAALITYYGFLSIFPLLLLLTSILGFVLRDDPGLQHRVLSSALGQFPGIGPELGAPGRLGGHGVGLVVGIVGSLYGGLGVAQAGQNAMNVAWAVPRNNRPNPLKARGRSLLLLGTVGLGVVGTTVISAIASSASAFGSSLDFGLQVVVTLVSVALNIGIFWLAFQIATAADTGWRALLPGAVTAGIGWQILQALGTTYVNHVVRGASTSNGVFAFVLGLIAWIYLGALVAVVSTEINVVRAHHLYPRALLTPFTDAVQLTPGDERSYRDAAKAQRNKGFQKVIVQFTRHRRRPAAKP